MRILQFQRLIGTGAFGAVYLANMQGDRGFNRQVAVKVLHPDHPNAHLFMSRVRDEARLLGLLRDDNILEVLGLVSVAGRDAVIMDYVEGADLNALIEEGYRPPPRALAEIAAAMAGALSRAHQARHPGTGEPLGVIHRDVKPANVMITTRGAVKLLDFGVARARFEARESYTGQHVLGTLNYMAPEYIITAQVSPAADSYGLALTIWEGAAGEVYGQPRLAENLHRARINERLERIGETHAAFVPLLRRMLAWEAAERPSAAEIEQALSQIAEEVPGPGLRTWATDAVTAVMGRRMVGAKDEAGLVGQAHPIVDPEGEQSGSFPAMRSGILPVPANVAPAVVPPAPVDGQAPTRILPHDRGESSLQAVAVDPATMLPVEMTDGGRLATPDAALPGPAAPGAIGYAGAPRAFPVNAPVTAPRPRPLAGPRPAPSSGAVARPTPTVVRRAAAPTLPVPEAPPIPSASPPPPTRMTTASPASAPPAAAPSPPPRKAPSRPARRPSIWSPNAPVILGGALFVVAFGMFLVLVIGLLLWLKP